MSAELNEYGVPDNPPSEVKDNFWCLDFVKMKLTELREGKGQLTTKQLVELYKNAPIEDGRLDEIGQTEPMNKLELQKWADSTGNRWADKKDNELTELIFAKPKPEYNMGVDCHDGNAAFVVMRKDGEVMEYGNGKNYATFKAEVERAAKFYNIQPFEILKETD